MCVFNQATSESLIKIYLYIYIYLNTSYMFKSGTLYQISDMREWENYIEIALHQTTI